jgi:hypothetical protein
MIIEIFQERKVDFGILHIIITNPSMDKSFSLPFKLEYRCRASKIALSS